MDDIKPIERRTDAARPRSTLQIHRQQSINEQQPTEPAVQNKTPHNPFKSGERHDNSYPHVTLQDLAQKEQEYKKQKVQIERDIAHISAEIYTRKKCQEFNRASQRVRDKLISMNTVLRELQHLLNEGSQESDRKHRVQTFSNSPSAPPPAEQSISASPFSNPTSRPSASPKTKTAVPTLSTQFERSSHGAMFTTRNIAVLAGIINKKWIEHLQPVRSWLGGKTTSSNASNHHETLGQPGETLIASIEIGLSKIINDSNETPNLSNREESICWWDSIGVMISSIILFPTMYMSETYWSLSEKDIIGRIKSALEKWEELWYGKKDDTGSQSSAVSYFKQFMQCVSEITGSHGAKIKLNEVVAMSNESDVAELVAKHESLKKDLRSTLSNLEFAQKWAHDKRNQIPKIDP